MNNRNFESLTTQEKIGQLMMCGFDALDVNDHAISLIKEHHIGNIILFARNVKTPEQLFKLNMNLQKLAMASIGIPLFIGIDQEGGMVTRIFHGATHYPGAMTVSATDEPKNAYALGDRMGTELKALGINMNLAPVLDVNNNPKNPVIGVRSYSDDPNRVATYGIQMIKGLQNHMIAVGKHFPGHGDTHTDSHLSLPTVDHDIKRLEAVELVPFKKSIEAGLMGIMSSHINFPHLTEEGRPSTLSKNVLTKVLREQLKFEGLVVSDCMQMKGIQNHYTTPEACVMAIEAGIDILCVSHSEDIQVASYKRLVQAVERKELSEDLINERVKHVLKFKQSHIQLNLDQPFSEVKAHIINPENKAFAEDILNKAITCVKGTPLKLMDRALCIVILPKATTIADESDQPFDLIKQMQSDLPNLDVMTLEIEPDDLDIEKTFQKAKSYQQIIVTTYNANIYKNQIKLIEKLHSIQSDIHVVSMRNPYDLHMTQVIKNYVCLYESTPNAMKTFLSYLKGDVVCEGKVPIHVP